MRYFNLQKTTDTAAGASCSHITPTLTNHSQTQSQSSTSDAPSDLIRDWDEPWEGKT